MIAENVLELCGSTPLVPLLRIATNVNAEIVLKLEGFNPGHSVKDRAVLRMANEAERQGLLETAGTLIESTSGNTGIALSMVGSVRSYSVICVVDENLLPEKRTIMRAFGAELLTVQADTSGSNADLTEQRISVVCKLVEQLKGSINLNQYANPANPDAHYYTTANEIWQETGGEVDCIVISVGTGGTVSGIGHRLKELSEKVAICGVEPYGSIMFGGTKGPYLQQGPGNYFLPPNLNLDYVHIRRKVTDRSAFIMTRRLAREEGILVGGDSGGVVHIALQLAAEHPNWRRIVAVCPDNIEKYLDSVFSDHWMQQHGLVDG